MNESLKHLEEKIAYLERHVVEQDRAMLELADELAALRRSVKAMRDRSDLRNSGGSGGDEAATDERPPHY